MKSVRHVTDPLRIQARASLVVRNAFRGRPELKISSYFESPDRLLIDVYGPDGFSDDFHDSLYSSIEKEINKLEGVEDVYSDSEVDLVFFSIHTSYVDRPATSHHEILDAALDLFPEAKSQFRRSLSFHKRRGTPIEIRIEGKALYLLFKKHEEAALLSNTNFRNFIFLAKRMGAKVETSYKLPGYFFSWEIIFPFDISGLSD